MRPPKGFPAAALGLALALAAGAARLEAFDGSASTGGQALLMQLDARAVGMGSAYTAVAGGADALDYNPAGMDQLRAGQAEAGHLAWIQGVDDEYINTAFPIYGLGAWGLGLSYLYAQDQAYSDTGIPGGTFTDFSFSGKAAFSMQIGDTQNIGIEYKLLRESYGGQFDMGSAFDLGWQWVGGPGGIDFGAAAQNLGTPVVMGTTYNPLPISVKVGAVKHLSTWGLLSMDEEYQPFDSFNFVHFGGEISEPVGPVTPALRAGYIFGPQQAAGNLTGLSVGLGLGYGSWQLDYAYTPEGDLGLAQRLTLTYTLGD